MQQFEYKVLDVATKSWGSGKIDYQEPANKLNEFGRQGGEVVSCSDINKWEGASRAVIIILKRYINDNR
jgi:Domain of unknown function (DUF4177)